MRSNNDVDTSSETKARQSRVRGECWAARALGFILLAGALSLSGCQSVQPWQRGGFAEYAMRPDRDPLHTAMSEHIYFSREASSGGRGVGASGCGCN